MIDMNNVLIPCHDPLVRLQRFGCDTFQNAKPENPIMLTNLFTRPLLILLGLCVFLIGPASHAQEEAKDEDVTKRINQLVKALEADQFSVREKADRDLRRVGQKAIPALKEALKSPSAETRMRAKWILQDLGRSIYIVENITHPDLSYVTAIQVSPDAKYLYSSSWRANAVSIFRRDDATGELTHIQTISDADHNGAVSIRLSPDGKHAAATCFRSKAVILYERDPIKGTLKKLDVFRHSVKSGPLLRPMECGFSPDSQHLLVLDTTGMDPTTRQRSGSMVVLNVANQKLSCVQAHFGKEGCLGDGRGVDFHPNGKTLYVAGSQKGCVVVMDWDAKTGTATIKQVVHDEQNGVTGLSGVMGVACSSDGQFLYTSSGRFRGDHAVGVFSIDADGKLTRVHELINGKDKMGDFNGGNELIISPDGKNVYVTATKSGTLAGFRRDAKTGELTFIETVPLGQEKELGPAGVGMDPQGKNLYVAVESVGRIAIFKRQNEAE